MDFEDGGAVGCDDAGAGFVRISAVEHKSVSQSVELIGGNSVAGLAGGHINFGIAVDALSIHNVDLDGVFNAVGLCPYCIISDACIGEIGGEVAEIGRACKCARAGRPALEDIACPRGNTGSNDSVAEGYINSLDGLAVVKCAVVGVEGDLADVGLFLPHCVEGKRSIGVDDLGQVAE